MKINVPELKMLIKIAKNVLKFFLLKQAKHILDKVQGEDLFATMGSHDFQ